MSEWWTYRLTSFLLFSPKTYYRLFELYNRCDLAGATRGSGDRPRDRRTADRQAPPPRSHHRRPARRVLAVGRVGVPLSALRPNQLGGAVVRGCVRVRSDASRRSRRLRRPHRLHSATRNADSGSQRRWSPFPSSDIRCSRRSRDVHWTTAEIFGVTPDPTAIGTLATLALVRGRIRWLLLVVPLLWCAVAAATLWAMKTTLG